MTVLRPLLLAAASVALAGAATAPPASAVPRSVDLRTQPSFEIVGARSIDFAGEAVAPAGDVNGDRIDDVIVGAPNADGDGRRDAGAAYVVFGRRRGAALIRAHPRARIAMGGKAQGFRILGPGLSTNAGMSVAGAGDVNGDGLDDVVVGVPDAGPVVPGAMGSPLAGAAYIVFGRRSGATVDLAHLGTAGVTIHGAPTGSDQLGTSVAGGRDVNGDGKPDVVVTDAVAVPTPVLPPPPPPPPGTQTDWHSSAYVIFGGVKGGDLHVDALGAAGYRLTGGSLGTVSLAQDMNGDGRAEVVVGANDDQTTPERVHVAFGRAATDPVDLRHLGDGGFTLQDGRRRIETAIEVRGGGDVNGDGRGDLVAATYVSRGKDRYAGVAAIVFGAPSADPVWVDRPGPRLIRAIGPSVPLIPSPVPGRSEGMIGPTPLRAVTIVDDTDGDGLDDVLAGGFASPHGRTGAGSAFLLRGRRTPGDVTLTTGRGRVVRLDGAYAGDDFGSHAAPAGDFDGDGHADLLVSGSSSTRNGRLRAGAAWVLSGVRP